MVLATDGAPLLLLLLLLIHYSFISGDKGCNRFSCHQHLIQLLQVKKKKKSHSGHLEATDDVI